MEASQMAAVDLILSDGTKAKVVGVCGIWDDVSREIPRHREVFVFSFGCEIYRVG